LQALSVESLRKEYGPTIALQGVSFSVSPGEVFGLIGPNGSGKTTTLRVISTLIRPTSGTAKVFGVDVNGDQQAVRRLISYLPEESGVYTNLTGYDYLRFIGSLYAEDDSLDAVISRGAEISGLGDRLREKSGGYSNGMKRRLLIARVMMLEPKLAVLDEPTSGLDVVHATHVRRTIRDYARDHGVTVLLSSHNMLEVDYICDRLVLMNKGRILTSGTPAEIKRSAGSANLEDAFMKVIANG
jgi:ABC-2 type transport system ATP-binding protein